MSRIHTIRIFAAALALLTAIDRPPAAVALCDESVVFVAGQGGYDDGRTWPVAKTLEPGPSAYSDLAVGPDGTIYCLYARGRRDATTNSMPTLTLARLNLEWLTDGKDSLAGK